jgi:hypothetical protein
MMMVLLRGGRFERTRHIKKKSLGVSVTLKHCENGFA